MSNEMKDPLLPIAFPKYKSVGETGDWAVDQPQIDYHKCTKCNICVMVVAH